MVFVSNKIKIKIKIAPDQSQPIETLIEGEILESENKKFKAILETNGNFVIYSDACCNLEKKDIMVWSSNTKGKGLSPRRLIMHNDGNLILYDAKNVQIWKTEGEKKGIEPITLTMQDDGRLVITDSKKSELWATELKNYPRDPNLIAGVSYVKVLNGPGADSWLQISQLVVRNELGQNIAKGKPASAASNYPQTNPSIAVDGVEAPRKFPNIHFSGKHLDEFFLVDLQGKFDISSVEIFNRADCCEDRIIGAKVLLLDYYKYVLREAEITTKESKITLKFTNEPKPALNGVRFVKVLGGQNEDSWLQFSQLVVKNEFDVNVSRFKKASSSSNYYKTNFSTALDGVESIRSYPQIFYAGKSKDEYFMVDLGKDEKISKVILYNRADCCQNRISGAKVQLLDSKNKILKEMLINKPENKIELPTQ